MSVIAWDGKTVAADKQSTNAGMRQRVTKLRFCSRGGAIAWSGDQDSGEMMAQWYEGGADPAKFPACQSHKDDWARLIVFLDGKVFTYERQPVPLPVEDGFMAWGSGRDYAMGAMAERAGAVRAVQVASQFETGCGLGIDAIDLAERAA